MKTKSFFIGVFIFIFMVLGLQSCLYQLKSDHSKFSFMKKLITYEQAEVLFDEYSNTNYKLINEVRPNDLPDSRSYWYSLEDLENYLNYVKTMGRKKGYKNLGIRIYLGKYPKGEKISPKQKDGSQGYQTIFMIPTAEVVLENSERATVEAGQENMDITTMYGMNFSTLTPPPYYGSSKMTNTK